MRVIFMGTPDFAVPALQAVAAAHDVVAVYTRAPQPAGRGQRLRPSAVAAVATELGLPVHHPANLRDAEAQAALAALRADVAVVAAYGLILPPEVLAMPRHGCLNIHASLLPRWRGAAPIHRAIMAGDQETGVCIMQMAAGLDTGPVLLRATTPIGATDTTGDLHDRLAQMGAELVVMALAQLPRLTPEPQPDDGVTYAHKVSKDESRIDWTQPAEVVARQIRGLSPAPGAWCMMGKERLRLLNAVAVPGEGEPGTILAGAGLQVACGAGAVDVTRLQRAGRQPLATPVALRGVTLPARLG